MVFFQLDVKVIENQSACRTLFVFSLNALLQNDELDISSGSCIFRHH